MKKTQKPAPANGGRKTAQKKIKEIQSIVSCLFFLVQEANRGELPFVAEVLKESIAKIDRLSNCDELRELSTNIIDHSLFEAMNFLHMLATLSAERPDYKKILETLRQTLHAGPQKDSSGQPCCMQPTLQ
jgi:hypothetical protein